MRAPIAIFCVAIVSGLLVAACSEQNDFNEGPPAPSQAPKSEPSPADEEPATPEESPADEEPATPDEPSRGEELFTIRKLCSEQFPGFTKTDQYDACVEELMNQP